MRTAFYYLCLILFSLVVVCGCGKDNEDVIPDNGNKNEQGEKKGNGEKKDPEGTITKDIKEEFDGIRFRNEDGRFVGQLTWCPPDNFDFWIAVYGVTSGALRRGSIATVGKINNLGDIKSIPQAGWTIPIQNDSYFDQNKIDKSVTCQTGYGYVIKYEDYKIFEEEGIDGYKYTDIVDLKPRYIRLYVVDKLVDSNNKTIGIRIKYQKPFIP